MTFPKFYISCLFTVLFSPFPGTAQTVKKTAVVSHTPVKTQDSSSLVLFTVGGDTVTLGEFKRAFEKNNSGKLNNAKSRQDYLNLYINYKLKIKAAYAAGIDKLPSQQAEAAQFRDQLAEPFLYDGTRMEQLIKEATERSKTDILASYIYIPFTEVSADSAEKEIDAIYAQLNKGASFEKLAAGKGGSIGWITAFTLPYKPESILYDLKTGSYSKPVKSQSGYHIFKKEATRPSRGELTIAQILIGFKPSSGKADSLYTLQRTDSVYQALLKGASFSTLALQLSDDNETYRQGGELPPFMSGTYTPAFEAAAFALKKDGDISKPVLTEYGYHILKRISGKTIAQLIADPVYTENLRSRILHNSRAEQARDVLIGHVLKTAGSNLLVKENDLYSFTLPNLLLDTVKPVAGIHARTQVLQTGDRTLDALEWIRYVKTAQNPLSDQGKKKTLPELLDALRKYEAMQYYHDHLEDFKPEFAQQFREFKEGNMLFEIMQQEIWNKAATDTAGINQLYSGHRDRYKGNLEEVRSLVINDYQDLLEEKWLATLRNKYPVKVYASNFNAKK